MHLTFRHLLALVLALLAGVAAAQTPRGDKAGAQPALPLETGAPRLDVLQHVYIITAIGQADRLDDTAYLAGLDAIPVEIVERSDEGYVYGPVWARLRVSNAGDAPAQWRLDTLQGWGMLTDAYLLREGEPARLILANNWEDRGYAERYPQTLRPASEPFALAPGETADLYFDMPYGFDPDEEFWLRDEADFEQARLSDAMYETAVFGFRLALVAGIFAFAAVLRSRLALYYGLFSGLLTLFFLNTSGYTYAYLVGDAQADIILYTVIGLATIVVFGLMIQENIKARKNYPRYNAVLMGTLGLGILAGIATNALPLDPMIVIFMRAVSLALFVSVALYGAYIGVRDRHPGARQFLLATVVLFAIVMTGLMAWQPFYLFDAETINPIQLAAFTADALLFASALVSRAIALRRARDAAAAAELEAVTERARIAEELAMARDDHKDALQLAESRRRQLATTSHDLAQPLMSLQMSLKKLKGAEAVAEGISFLESVLRRNLRDTRPDSPPGAADSHRTGTERFALDQTLRNVALMFADEAQEKRVDLRYVPTSVEVACDPVPLMRIVINLVANALQHSAGGRVLIGARRGADAVRVQVVDDGAGMTEEEAERTFAPYVSGAGSKGEGLGLSVVKTLAEGQGFSIAVRSKAGIGTTFTIGRIALAPAGPVAAMAGGAAP